MQKIIQPIAIPGIHEKFEKFLKQVLDSYQSPKILDIGAGHGAFTKILHEKGYEVAACDMFPENFYYNEIECKKVDITTGLPYEDNTFDVLMAVEVMEHIHDHITFMKECNRILKPGGVLLFSTPNILSLKSRIRFLFSGFYYSFKPLEHERTDGLQHLSSLTIDQYRNLGLITGFKEIDFNIDKQQSTSKLLLFLVPLLKIYCKLKSIDYNIHNQTKYLTGRILFVSFRKDVFKQ